MVIQLVRSLASPLAARHVGGIVGRGLSSVAGPRGPLRSVLARRAASTEASSASTAGASAAGGQAVESYSRSLQALHWLMGAGMLTCVATVKMAQWTEDKKKKGQYMMIHKSTALLVAALVVPRIFVRLTSKLPRPVPGVSKLQQLAASSSHVALYIGIVGLPTTGIAMGYFGGKGLPFYGAHIPGAAEPNKNIAKTAFKVHKKMGQVLEYLLPLHIAGTVVHTLQGVSMFSRMGFALSPASTTAAAVTLAALNTDNDAVDASEMAPQLVAAQRVDAAEDGEEDGEAVDTE